MIRGGNRRTPAAVPAPSPQPAVPGHEDELTIAHGCVPSPAAAVKRGVTAASGEGHGRWPRLPI
jgi:hypothetical protein